MARKKEKNPVWPYVVAGVIIWYLWRNSKPNTAQKQPGGGGGALLRQTATDAAQLANEVIDATTFVPAPTDEEQYKQQLKECK